MAIKKQYLKSKPVCKVTFTVPAEEAKKVAVVGDFNDWNPKGSMLKKLKNGTFKGTFDLPMEQSFEFRYLIDGQFSAENFLCGREAAWTRGSAAAMYPSKDCRPCRQRISRSFMGSKKGDQMTPKEVLALCREKDVKAVNLRFMDFPGL